MADPTPAPRPGRNARRRARTERTIEEAYEAGVRDGRAENAEPTPGPATADEILDRVAQALYQHAVTAGGRYPNQPSLLEEHTRQTFLASAAHRAAAVMTAITPALDARWEQGRKHGLRQAWAPQRGRERQLEEEIESMLTIEEANSTAWLAKCERVRELEAENARVQALADRRWVAWQSARRGRAQQRDALRGAMAADRDQVRRTRDRYRDERDTARCEAVDLRAQLAATTAPHRAEGRLAADARPDSTPSPETVAVHLEAVDSTGQTASGGYNVMASATVEQRDGRDVTVLTVPPGRWLLSVAPHGRGRPRTITHIRFSGLAGELALVPLREPRRFARPGDVEASGLRAEIPGRLAADAHPYA